MKKFVLCILTLVVICLVISKAPKLAPVSENNKLEAGEILQKEITFSLSSDGMITMQKSVLNFSPIFFAIKIENPKQKKYILGFLDDQFEMVK